MTTMTATMTPAELATRFHEACITGEGWAACKPYCAPGATLRHDTTKLWNDADAMRQAGWV
jgi:hypothetical protein